RARCESVGALEQVLGALGESRAAVGDRTSTGRERTGRRSKLPGAGLEVRGTGGEILAATDERLERLVAELHAAALETLGTREGTVELRREAVGLAADLLRPGLRVAHAVLEAADH